MKEKISEEDNEKIQTTLENGKSWLDTHQNEDADVYDMKLKDSQEIITPIITKLYEQTNAEAGSPPEGMSAEGMSGGASVEEVD